MSELVERVREKIVDAEPLVVTGAELARELDAPVQDVLQALRTLEYAGDVESKETGANAIAWWATSRARPAPGAETDTRERAQAAAAAPADASTRNTTRPAADGRGGASAAGDAAADAHPDAGAAAGGLEAAIASANLPGSGEKLDRRREALRLAVDLLQERGEITATELRETVYEQVDTGYSSPRSTWKNALQPALSEISEDVDALKKADETGLWRWESYS